MALKSTIFKAQLAVADIDHGHYADHALTLARHPSETDERMLVRLVALAFDAHHLSSTLRGDGTLGFGAGLSDPDDPDVRLVDYTGAVRLWIEVGQPDERALQRASSRADAVHVYAYAPGAELWWKALEPRVARMQKLRVFRLPAEATQALAGWAERTMLLSATIQDGALTLAGAAGSVVIEPQRLK
jgi:uncharacterized protein YaeQ